MSGKGERNPIRERINGTGTDSSKDRGAGGFRRL